MLQSMGSQRVKHNLATEQQQQNTLFKSQTHRKTNSLSVLLRPFFTRFNCYTQI